MALCVQSTVDGFLQVVGDYSEACTGFVVMTASEYASTPTLAALFTVPDSSAIATAFLSAMSLPLILWLTSWGFGVVVSFIDRETELQVTLTDH
jgi:hypothetical protein